MLTRVSDGPRTILNRAALGIALATLAAPLASGATGHSPPATHAEVLGAVRLAALAPGFAKVPGPSVSDPPFRRPSPPTWRDRARLLVKLHHIDDALRIHRVTANNTERPIDAIAAHGTMLYTYTPGGFYEVDASTFHETALELEPGETLTGGDLPTAGDTARWTIAATLEGSGARARTVLLVKPLASGLDTDMMVTTNRRLYTILLHSSRSTYMPLVAWLYPQDVAREKAAKVAAAKARASEEEPLTVAPDELNFDCRVRGPDVTWKPIRVYDDGSKTFLQMSPKLATGDAPAIFVMQKSTPMLVNFRVKHSIYIVDRLFDHAELRTGSGRAVEIYCHHRER